MGQVIGVDEVGRGCLAGPLLVVAAKAASGLPPGLKDSKLLSKKQREKILDLLSICCEFGEGWVSPAEIDRYGLAQAMRLGSARALKSLVVDPSERIIMDGSVNYLPKKYLRASVMIKADNLVPIVSAASIYAKVTRDKYMSQLAEKYPQYSFERHVGYGTKAHMLAIKQLGALKYVHRQSFVPANLSGA